MGIRQVKIFHLFVFLIECDLLKIFQNLIVLSFLLKYKVGCVFRWSWDEMANGKSLPTLYLR